MTDIDPAAVMAAHAAHCESPLCCEQTRPDHEYNNGHCEPYRLAEALAASEAKVARVLDLGRYWNGPGHAPGRWDSSHAMDIRAAIEDTLDWSMWDEMAGRWAHERGLDQPEQAS